MKRFMTMMSVMLITLMSATAKADDIKIAESNTPEAKKIYDNLIHIFREQYSNLSLARD